MLWGWEMLLTLLSFICPKDVAQVSRDGLWKEMWWSTLYALMDSARLGQFLSRGKTRQVININAGIPLSSFCWNIHSGSRGEYSTCTS